MGDENFRLNMGDVGADPAEFEPHRPPGTPRVDAPRFRTEPNHFPDPSLSAEWSDEFCEVAGSSPTVGPSAQTGVVEKCSSGIRI